MLSALLRPGGGFVCFVCFETLPNTHKQTTKNKTKTKTETRTWHAPQQLVRRRERGVVKLDARVFKARVAELERRHRPVVRRRDRQRAVAGAA